MSTTQQYFSGVFVSPETITLYLDLTWFVFQVTHSHTVALRIQVPSKFYTSPVNTLNGSRGTQNETLILYTLWSRMH